MAYFKLRCFDQTTTKYILITANVILAILGVIHWGYCGLIGKLMNTYSKYNLPIDQIKPLYDSMIAFFVICGIQQILTSVGVVLLLLSYLGATQRYLWTRVMMGFLLIDFGFNFYVAVGSSMSSTYYTQLLQKYLSGGQSEMDNIMKTFYGFNVAQAILTFIIALPSIIITIIAMLQENVNFDESEQKERVIPQKSFDSFGATK